MRRSYCYVTRTNANKEIVPLSLRHVRFVLLTYRNLDMIQLRCLDCQLGNRAQKFSRFRKYPLRPLWPAAKSRNCVERDLSRPTSVRLFLRISDGYPKGSFGRLQNMYCLLKSTQRDYESRAPDADNFSNYRTLAFICPFNFSRSSFEGTGFRPTYWHLSNFSR